MDPSTIAKAIQSLLSANNHTRQQAELPSHLKPFLNHAIPRLDQSHSVAFIASDIWFGDSHTELAAAVEDKCFHPDVQSRRIIGIVQAYGCGKTKTGLRLSDSFILLPIRFNVGSMGSITLADAVLKEQQRLLTQLGDSPTQLQVQQFSQQCFRLVHLFFLSLVALYDYCVANTIIDDSAAARFTLALLLLTDNQHIVQWCRAFFLQHQDTVQDENAFSTFAHTLMMKLRTLKVVFLLDEVHALFGKAQGFCLHQMDGTSSENVITGWRDEQIHGKPSSSHISCTDLFYQFRVVMLDNLLNSANPFGFIMCSTMFRTWKILEEENSPLSRGTIDQFFRLHWFTYSEIISAVQTLFEVKKSLLEELEYATDGSDTPSYKRLSAYSRPLFLMEFLERLCKSFFDLPDASDVTVRNWLRKALENTAQSTMQRARSQIETLVTNNTAVDMWTSQQIVHLLYITHRLCGGTLALCDYASDEPTLANLISKGVARLDGQSSRFRISDDFFAEALLQRYTTLQDQNDAVLKMLAHNTNLSRALISHDNSAKGFIVERLLAWLALSGQLRVAVLHPETDDCVMKIVASTAKCAGTLAELGVGTHSAEEPSLLVKIMEGSAQYVLLPTTLAGPDLWLRATIDNERCVIAVQSKVESCVYSMTNFLAALKSLNPFDMYSSDSAARARSEWLPHLQLMKTMSYHRIIFSACGFDNQVQLAVCEYNLARGRGAPGQPSRYIHLLHLDDIRNSIGPVYGTIKEQLTTSIRPSEPIVKFVLSRQWRDLSLRKRNDTKLAELQQHCQHRGITATKKRKAQLVDVLNEASVEDHVADLVSALDPRFI